MFKSAVIFRIAPGFHLPPLDMLEQALQSHRFTPCAPTQTEASGWTAPRGKKSAVLAEAVGPTGVLVQLQIERRQVPASAVNDEVDARIAKHLEETGRERAGSKLKKEFKEEALLSLLPRAFPRRRQVLAWLDTAGGFVIVDTASLAGADEVISALVATLAECGVFCGTTLSPRPLQTQMPASTAMAHWLRDDEVPPRFTVDRDCELKAQDDSKSTVRYSSHTLEINEVGEHIAAGKIPVKLALTWNERVSFELSDLGCLRKLKLLDVVLDGVKKDGDPADDGFDTDVAIATGELAALIPGLIEALGGELAGSEAAALAQTLAANLSGPGLRVTIKANDAPLAVLGDEPDPLYGQALDCVRQQQKASISLVQRHLKVGYNRAARLVERMESEGRVTAANAAGARDWIAA